MAEPKRYRAFYIEPGLADYSAEGIGLVLVQKPALDKMSSTFVGMPVVNFAHTDKEPEDLFNLSPDELDEFADGIVAATGYDDESGWFWADMMVWDDDTQTNLENGYSVSCAYDVMNSAPGGGKYHNVEYEEEVLDGDYKHMAVVPNPRYEQAWVIQNSKPGGNAVLRKNKKPRKNMTPPEDVENTEEEGYVMNEDGSQMPLAELVNMYRESMKNADEMEELGDDYMVNVDGEDISIADMKAACNMGGVENADDEEEEDIENAEPAQDDEAEEVVDETRQNSAPKAKKAADRKNMSKVRNAAREGGADKFKPKNLNTVSERLTRGKSRYGAVVAQGGK